MISAATAPLEPARVSEVVQHWESIDRPFSHALRSGVSPAQALVRLGIHLCIQERYSDSLMVLRAAVTLSPDDPVFVNNLAVVLERAGHTEEAIAAVERSLALAQGQPDSWIFLGNMKRKQGDLVGAQAAYETALRAEDISPLAWQGLGFIKQEQRQPLAAIECFITSIRQSSATAPLLAILGQLFYQTGQFTKSRDAYAAAVDYDPPNAVYRRMHREAKFVCAAIDGDSVEAAVDAYLRDRPSCPGAEDKDVAELLQTSFSLVSAFGHQEAARRIGAQRAALFPSAAATYLLQALAGDASLRRSPDAYLVEYFDAYADRFDEHLVHGLGYDIPQKLAAALAAQLPRGSRMDILDAGCGTGLCGPCVRPFAASLTGVDLSPAMLEHASARRIYDRLACCELSSFLTSSPIRFDVIIAADVFIYFGELASLAAALAPVLRPGGLVAFSTERGVAPGHHLLRSGRFAHDPAYVQCIFQDDFTPCLAQEATIRLEACHPVPGNLFVFRRR